MSYTHFTTSERKNLEKLLSEDKSLRQIAALLGRSPSSISREIKRNKAKTISKAENKYLYHHWHAYTVCAHRRKEHVRRVLTPGTQEWNYIIEKLKSYWTPEQIVNRYKKDYGCRLVSVSTIYRYIYRGELPKITKKHHLRRRGKRKMSKDCDFNTIHPDRIIPEWPQEIRERSRVGDWEGDTVYGAVGKGLVVTLVDRKSRYLLAGKLENRFAEQTEKVIVNLLKEMPVKSLSLDNGSEFANFKEIEAQILSPIYFAEPHKPWQRGTNENTNDVLRFFFPKGTDFTTVSDEDLAEVVYLINTRPRKCLGWLSPFEVFWGVALT